jgi:hypothetical protein
MSGRSSSDAELFVIRPSKKEYLPWKRAVSGLAGRPRFLPAAGYSILTAKSWNLGVFRQKKARWNPAGWGIFSGHEPEFFSAD